LKTGSFQLQKAAKKPDQKITKKLQREPPYCHVIASLSFTAFELASNTAAVLTKLQLVLFPDSTVLQPFKLCYQRLSDIHKPAMYMVSVLILRSVP
jgi:hypothetical protein